LSLDNRFHKFTANMCNIKKKVEIYFDINLVNLGDSKFIVAKRRCVR